MNFEKTGEFIRLEDYFEGRFPDNRILPILKENFLGWVLVENIKEKSLSCVLHVTDYDYNLAHPRLNVTCDKESENLTNNINNNVEILDANRHFRLIDSDIIYKLEKIKEDNREPIVKWYKKGKFENLKSFDEFEKI